MSMQNGVAAGFICHEPDLARFQAALGAMIDQAERIYVADNASACQKDLSDFLAKSSAAGRIVFLPSESNRGVSEVLDDLLKRAEQDHMTWLISMDQDSILEDGALAKLVETGEKYQTAVVSPLVRDIRRKNETAPKREDRITETEFCITSGCLMNVKEVLACGGMDRFLFIDFVDTELCHRLHLAGKRILLDHRVMLDHELGTITPARLEKFWLFLAQKLRLPALGKLSYHREVVPLRMYYATRNALYLEEKYRDHPHPFFSEKWAVQNGISSILRGRQKIRIWKAFRRGLKDGKKAKAEVREKRREE